MWSCILSCFQSHHLSCHSWQPSGCISETEQGLLKSPACGRIGSLIWAPAGTLEAEWCRHQGGDGNARLGRLCSLWQHTSWWAENIMTPQQKKNHSPCSSWNARGRALLAPFPHRLVPATSEFSAFPWQLLQVVDKHFLVMDTGSSSKRHLKQQDSRLCKYLHT